MTTRKKDGEWGTGSGLPVDEGYRAQGSLPELGDPVTQE